MQSKQLGLAWRGGQWTDDMMMSLVEDLLSGGGCGQGDTAEGGLVKRPVCRDRQTDGLHMFSPSNLYVSVTLGI